MWFGQHHIHNNKEHATVRLAVFRRKPGNTRVPEDMFETGYYFSLVRMAGGGFHVSSRPPEDWWRRTGSNRRPPACKAGALPTELRPLLMTGCRDVSGVAIEKWWAWVDLNYRPHAYQACALTKLSYRPITLGAHNLGMEFALRAFGTRTWKGYAGGDAGH